MALVPSKFKYNSKKTIKRSEYYNCPQFTDTIWNSTFCSVNQKYLAIITEAFCGNTFSVISIEKNPGVLVVDHEKRVLDIQFCHHDNNIIASASEDGIIRIWQIPDNLRGHLKEPIAQLVGHKGLVGLVLWHPTAKNVLLSSGIDNRVMIWNVDTKKVLVKFPFLNMIISACFNFDGSKLVTSCQDGFIRVFNVITRQMLTIGKGHEGIRPQSCVYLKDDKILTAGFTHLSMRQFALWDDTDLRDSLMLQDIDISDGAILPWYDAACNLIYLAGKGGSVILYLEYSSELNTVRYINKLSTKEPIYGIGWMPKKVLDNTQGEFARCFVLYKKMNICHMIPFIMPNASELSKEELDNIRTVNIPTLSAEEWSKDIKEESYGLDDGDATGDQIAPSIMSRLDPAQTQSKAITYGSNIEIRYRPVGVQCNRENSLILKHIENMTLDANKDYQVRIGEKPVNLRTIKMTKSGRLSRIPQDDTGDMEFVIVEDLVLLKKNNIIIAVLKIP